MGERTTISGHIQEAWYVRGTGPKGDHSILRRLEDRNQKTIAELPEADEWPYLCRGMFAIAPSSDGRYPLPCGNYRGRVIHFGGSFSSLWRNWSAWLDKFEALLRRLYWEHAALVMVTETMGSFFYEWSVTTESFDGYALASPVPPTAWEFTGGPREF